MIPTLSGVREFSEITPSSSSSLVWKLGIRVLRAGRSRYGHVCPMWAGGLVLLSTRGQNDGCAPATAVVHDLSPARTRRVPRASAIGHTARPSRADDRVVAGQRR